MAKRKERVNTQGQVLRDRAQGRCFRAQFHRILQFYVKLCFVALCVTIHTQTSFVRSDVPNPVQKKKIWSVPDWWPEHLKSEPEDMGVRKVIIVC